jgi:hypothetical protein
MIQAKGGYQMPLEKGKSDKAFSHNVRAEMDAGKPQKQSLAIAYAMKRKAKKMAGGGFIAKEEAEYDPTQNPPDVHDERAMVEDDRDLNQHGEIEEGPQGMDYAMGGEAEVSDAQMLDMVGRIMAQRQRMYSKGGRVANDTPPEADSERADYDELPAEDELEFHDTGANSGDELDDAREDHDRRDIVSRIMKSRGKRDRMPHPA